MNITDRLREAAQALTHEANSPENAEASALLADESRHMSPDEIQRLAALSHRVTMQQLDVTDDPSQRADLYMQLAGQQRDAGLHSDALDTIERAVGIYRRLVADDPATYEGDLAAALDRLGIYLSTCRRDGDALAANNEAVTRYRRLAQVDPAAYERQLGRALANLAGRRLPPERCIGFAREAIAIGRRWTRDDPTRGDVELAGALHNLGILLSELGRYPEAVTATWEAVEIRISQAARAPGHYDPMLSGALHNLAVLLAEAGQEAEALDAAKWAVAVDRRLATANPAVYEGALARSLTSLGYDLSEAEEHMEALAVTDEAVVILQRLTAADPAIHEGVLAAALLGFAWVRAGADSELAEALTAATDAASIYRRLAEDMHEAYGTKVRAAETLVLDLQEGLGRSQQAGELRRLLLEDHASAFGN